MAETPPLQPNNQGIKVKPHYAFVTRLLLDLFLRGELPNVREITIEPEYGYVGRLVYQDNSVRMFRGSDIGVNSSSAKQVAADKGYTKYFLNTLGYNTPPGKTFLLPHYVQLLDKSLSKYAYKGYAHIEEMDQYITSTIGYPCFIKPNDGSQGKGVSKCLHKYDVEVLLTQYQKDQVDVLLVEKALSWPDYRVIVFKNEVSICYLRTPLSVIGDGQSTIIQLLQRKREHFAHIGRTALIDMDDASIARRLARSNYTLETILPQHELCPINDVSNLSVGGEAEDFTTRICQRWRDVCINITADMGLRLCGVDIACSDIENADADYSILEINDSPGLVNYAAVGEMQHSRVKMLYQKIFANSPIS